MQFVQFADFPMQRSNPYGFPGHPVQESTCTANIFNLISNVIYDDIYGHQYATNASSYLFSCIFFCFPTLSGIFRHFPVTRCLPVFQVTILTNTVLHYSSLQGATCKGSEFPLGPIISSSVSSQ